MGQKGCGQCCVSLWLIPTRFYLILPFLQFNIFLKTIAFSLCRHGSVELSSDEKSRVLDLLPKVCLSVSYSLKPVITWESLKDGSETLKVNIPSSTVLRSRLSCMFFCRVQVRRRPTVFWES